MMKKAIGCLMFLGLLFVVSCQSDPSLQKYLVDHQDSEGFIQMDLSGNMIYGNLKNVSEEDKENIKAFRKLNMLVLPINGENKQQYEKELGEVQHILNSVEYRLLAGFHKSDISFKLYYLGSEEAIKEVVVFTFSDEKGFAILRILTKDLNPEKFYSTLKSLQRGDFDLNLDGLEDFLEEY